jgi:hypothetical protein
VATGSLIERGTDPKLPDAGHNRPFTAFWQSTVLRISPSIKRKFGLLTKSSKLCLCPWQNYPSIPSCPLDKKYSQRLEPINPAPPVINILFYYSFISINLKILLLFFLFLIFS